MDEQLYLKCVDCGEVFEGNEPHIAKQHEPGCKENWPTYELVTESEAF